MNIITQITGITQQRQELMKVSAMLSSIGNRAKSQEHLQVMLINPIMNRYLLTEITKAENEFLKIIKEYKIGAAKNKKQEERLYRLELARIGSFYGGGIMARIKAPKNNGRVYGFSRN